MSSPWLFVPNVALDVWLSPSDPTTDPPDYANIDCQQMRPYFTQVSILPPVMIHRFILQLSDVGNVESTQFQAGVWVSIKAFTGDYIGWIQIYDASPFGYNDPIVGYKWDVIMWSGRMSNF